MSTIETEVTALAVIETMTPAKLFEPGTIDPLIERIKTEVRSVAIDTSTGSGRKACASLAFKVARSKTFIDKQRLELVRDEKKRLAAIDKEGTRIWNELEDLQKEVRKPLTDWEDAEKARVAKIEADIAEIENAGNYTLQNWQTLPIEAMEDRRKEITSQQAVDWQDYSSRAKLAIQTSVNQITDAIQRRQEFDAQQAELTKLRAEAAERAEADRKAEQERQQKERDERIAQAARDEAELKAKRETELLEREKREADEARIRAEERAKQAAEEATRREQERVAKEKADADAAEAKREANKKHVAKVNREAVAALVAAGINADCATQAIELVAEGKVPNVRISY
jgi:hypothetical protein